MKLFMTSKLSLERSLPPEAIAWLKTFHSTLTHYFTVEWTTCEGIDLLFSAVQNYDDLADGALARKILTDLSLESCLILDGRYPFISTYDLSCLISESSSDNNFATLRTCDDKVAAFAFSKNSQRVTCSNLPKFRSICVDTLAGWMIAKKIQENWPLFYFNDSYASYWLDRTAIKNAETDKVTDAGVFLLFFAYAIRHMDKNTNNKLLDAGCGYGRFFKIFKEKNFDITGIDISWEMVSLCREHNYAVFQGTLEETGMRKSRFDFINAWAVFDCADQNRALHHLLGRLVLGGVILLSGKNDSYHIDDQLALEAEKGGASKLFPNGFTNFESFGKAVEAYGGKIVEAYYGEYRGDIAKKNMLKEKPSYFYEWIAIIKKEAETPVFPNDYNLSSPHSRNYQNVS